MNNDITTDAGGFTVLQPMRAWRMTDDDIWCGRTYQEAGEAFREQTGEKPDPDYAEIALSDRELDAEIPEFDENEADTGRTTTLRRYLNEATEAGFLAGAIW